MFKFVSLFVALVALARFANAAWYTADCPGGYRLESGETVYNNIAYSDASATCAWLSYNGITNPCSLQAGKCLYPPPAGALTSCPAGCPTGCCPNTSGSTYGNYYYNGYGSYSGSTSYNYIGCGSGKYTVQAGNTFWSLGGATAGGMCAWINANPGVDPCNLSVNSCLTAPTSSTSTSCPSYISNYSCRLPYPTGYYSGSGYYSGPYWGSGSVGTNTYCNCGPNKYCIQPGDTFCNLAGRNTALACSWVNSNSGVNYNNLQVGQCVNNPYNTYSSWTSTATGCGFTC